jgi:hypothetical protein
MSLLKFLPPIGKITYLSLSLSVSIWMLVLVSFRISGPLSLLDAFLCFVMEDAW